MRIELATEPGDPAITNEDFVAATADTVVVLDGVTPLNRADTGCRHGVAWFARTLGAELVARASGATTRLVECLAAAIEGVRDRHASTCDLAHADSPAATVAVVRVGADAVEYLVLGDAPIIMDSGGSPTVVADDRPARTGHRIRTARPDLVRPGAASTELARAVRAHRNRPDGYWVAAEDPAAAEEALTGRLPLAELATVVVASDGAARLVEELGQLDWAAALAALTADGAAAWIARTRAAERADVARRRAAGKPKRGKPHDDATIAVLTELNGRGPRS